MRSPMDYIILLFTSDLADWRSGKENKKESRLVKSGKFGKSYLVPNETLGTRCVRDLRTKFGNEIKYRSS